MYLGTGSDPFGSATLNRPWTVDSTASFETILSQCKARVDAAFEIFVKLGIFNLNLNYFYFLKITFLGVDFYAFHDRDVAPELETIQATNELLDKVTDYMLVTYFLTAKFMMN